MKTLATPETPSDSAELARDLVTTFGQMLQWYQKHYEVTPQEAIARINESTDADKQRILETMPDQVSWRDLHLLGNAYPALAIERWEAIKRAALSELRTGHRAVQAIDTGDQTPWQKAQFLALRTDLADEWQPRNGMERQLIDIMAQAQSSYLYWLRTLTVRSCLENYREKEDPNWQRPRLDDADAMEQASAMMDRFNRIFLRTLRALRDLRRFAGPVIVQNGGQLNVANQQVNIAGSKGFG